MDQTKQQKQPDVEGANSIPVGCRFADILAQCDKGKGEINASQKLVELISDIRAFGKSGSITVKLDFAPIEGDANQLSTKCEISVKAPKAQAKSTLFYSTEKGLLTREDPRQLALRGVDLDNQK